LSDLEDDLANASKQIKKLTAEQEDAERNLQESMRTERERLLREAAELRDKLDKTEQEKRQLSETYNRLQQFDLPSPAAAFANEKKRAVGSGLDAYVAGSAQSSTVNSPDPGRRNSARLFSVSSESGIIPRPLSRQSLDATPEYDEFGTGPPSPADTMSRVENSSGYGGSSGVSVQLVGKMNTTIRRLESDLANCRQDLVKMTKSKDDAYQEVIKLMKVNDELLTYKDKAASLEARIAELETREQTTLEMLGEKSELVEELRADVEDLKTMYRQQIEDLVDRLHSDNK
jgi:hypothetical protein